MKRADRKEILVGVASVGVIITIVGLSYGYFQDQRGAAQAQSEEVVLCRQLADKIEAARGVSGKQPDTPAATLDLPRAIAAAAAKASLPGDCIEGIHPDAIRRASSGGAVEKPTRLTLRHITLQQVLALLVEIDKPNEGLRVERFQINAEPAQSEQDLWSAEAVLVHSSPMAGPAPGAASP
ncbi:MAG TPA: hypothetical protein VG326_00155 [Tepidisphaeraceae bacterium]|jgi:hypothetical protein|nr:hypothetical protein [Tepidisphaeraceae bacterium]